MILRDGRIVDVRPVIPGDGAELGEAMRSADPDTLNRRFLGGPPPVTPALLKYLTVLDYRTRFALVARDRVTGRGVAIARYERVADGVAEVAVVVDPGWRRVGLATALVHLLGEAALARGISTFTASFLVDNQPVAALVADAGGASFIADGIAHLEVALAAPGAGRSSSRLSASPGLLGPLGRPGRGEGAPGVLVAGQHEPGPVGHVEELSVEAGTSDGLVRHRLQQQGRAPVA